MGTRRLFSAERVEEGTHDLAGSNGDGAGAEAEEEESSRNQRQDQPEKRKASRGSKPPAF